MVYAIFFGLAFFTIIGTAFYLIYTSWKNFDPSDVNTNKGAMYARKKSKYLGPGHGLQTPYGTASSNGAASTYVARTRNK